MDQALELSGCALAGSKALLGVADDVVLFCEVGKDNCDKASPQFVDRGVEANRTFIWQVGGVPFFMEDDSVGSFPLSRCGPCQP
jgi:hypothetical protein